MITFLGDDFLHMLKLTTLGKMGRGIGRYTLGFPPPPYSNGSIVTSKERSPARAGRCQFFNTLQIVVISSQDI